MAITKANQQKLEEGFAERYKPWLVLYPEINSESRRKRPDWRSSRQAPLYEDYHPRDVRLVLDHARIPGRASLHNADRLVEELEGKPSIRRMDLLQGMGHRDRGKFWREYYRIVNNKGSHQHDGPYPHCAYVHFVYGDHLAGLQPADQHVSSYTGLVAIQYWFIYLYNDWKAPHEGDWEHIVLFLRDLSDSASKPEPTACAYSAHHGGYRLPWRHVEKVDDQGERAEKGTHPVVYVANGSHANYFFGPCHYETTTEQFGVRITAGEFPFSGEYTDFTTSFESGTKIFPQLKIVPAPVDGHWTGQWRWLNFSGTWGSKGLPTWPSWLRKLPILGGTWKGPASLPQRNNWSNPFAWADRECDEAPPMDTWLVRQ